MKPMKTTTLIASLTITVGDGGFVMLSFQGRSDG